MAVRDTEWLTLEACREFQRGTCSRSDTECKYAHPSKSVLVDNGRVIACYDSLKGQCTRENCKYLHPPPHLKTQLEINGRNNLAAKKMLQNLQHQQLTMQAAGIPIQQATLIPATTLPSAGTQSVPTSQTTAEMNALYNQYVIPFPVTVSMNPSVSQSGISQMYAPYMPAISPHHIAPGAGTGLTAGTNSPHPMGLEIPLHAQMIQAAPNHLPIVAMKAPKNDRLELPTTPETPNSLKRPRDPAEDLLIWNYKDMEPSSTWLASQNYKDYFEGTSSPIGIMPPPPKRIPSISSIPNSTHLAHHHSALVPQNFLTYQHPLNHISPFQIPPQPQFLPAHHFPFLQHGPAGVPFLTPHIPMPQHQTSETLPVCRDFKSGSCKRPSCKYAHVTEDYVEITDGKVTVCRYAVQNRCTRPRCKFYHPPTATTPVQAVVNSIPTLPTPGVTNA